MIGQQGNKTFVKMLEEFPKVFGRVSFRERLMLRAAFDYVNGEVIDDLKANFDYVLEGKNLEIKELKITDEYIIKTLESKVEKLQEDLRNKRISIKNKKAEINELIKENAELKKRLVFARAEFQRQYKENEELKTDKQYWEQKANRLTTEWGETLDQLTRAKNIIKQFLNDYPVITKELLDKLEQFIKEIEK